MPIPNSDSLVEIRVRVPRDRIEQLTDFITDRICSGLMQEDEGEAAVAVFYSSPGHAGDHIASVKDFLAHILGSSFNVDSAVSAREIQDLAWEEAYRQSVQAVVIGGDVAVRPPWATAPTGITYDIVIEPKMAFGTGTHETTRSCLKIIRESFQPGMRFLDLGCGSGILSILADKMGASYIKAIDYDLVAVDNTRENFDINSVNSPHDLLFGSIEKTKGDQPYQYIVANIIKSTILDMLPRLVELTASPGRLVLSGLLAPDLEEINVILDTLGATDRTILEDNEWRTITVNRP